VLLLLFSAVLQIRLFFLDTLNNFFLDPIAKKGVYQLKLHSGGKYYAVSNPATCFSKEPEIEHLFRIERSKNANVVQYDAQLTPEGKLKPEKPVIAYWIMNANSGEKEDLNWVEKKMA